MLFFGFSKCLRQVIFLVKKIFAFRYLFTISVVIVQQDAATRFRVAERQCRHSPLAWRQEDSHFFHFQSGQSVACKGIAQLKKTQDPLDICYLFLEESQKASVLGCGINRKCLVFRLEFFLFAVLFEEHATDTDRLRKRVRWREKPCFIMNFYAPSPFLT